MSSQGERARSVFLEAVGLDDPQRRASFLDEACKDQPEVRRRVEQLLEAHDRPESLLDHAAIEIGGAVTVAGESAVEEVDEALGTMIGPYRLIERLGEGGMGVVYLAEQAEPVRRKVALKIIKPGMDSRQVIARFEAERQALALMDHPNIARVMDAGTTGAGRPYFVMELVDGIPITSYCDQGRLSIPERLEIFVHVCAAVQHAHQKGVIHRDLKPTNILVTLHDGAPLPKVIDFGVAKATGQRLTDKTLYSGSLQLVGTPLYMSPEQAEHSGLDIDTRSDIYSLGVLLYELLTGTTPFDQVAFTTASLDEIRRVIREADPPTPSKRLSGLRETLPAVSINRGSDPSGLSRMLRGDLDWIVMKTLEKDRNRRYESANELAADVTRYLRHLPVAASPPSTWYRFRKYSRRNRLMVLSSALVATAMASGTAVSIWMAVRAKRAESAAVVESEKVQVINEFLVNDLLSQADPERNAAPNRITLREALDRASDRLAERFRGQPLLEADLHITFGRIYHSLQVRDRRRRHYAAALAIYDREKGAGAVETARAMAALGRAFEEEGRIAEAEPLLRQGLGRLRALLGNGELTTLNAQLSLAGLCAHSGRLAEAEQLLIDALDVSRRVQGEESPATLTALNLLAGLGRGNQANSPPMELKLLEINRRVRGEEHPETLTAMNNLAVVYRNRGNLKEAESLFIKTLAGSRRVLGTAHRNTFFCERNLGRLYLTQGRLTEAEPLLISSYEGLTARDRSVPGNSDNSQALILKQIIQMYEAWGKPEKAREWKARVRLEDLPADVFASP